MKQRRVICIFKKSLVLWNNRKSALRQSKKQQGPDVCKFDLCRLKITKPALKGSPEYHVHIGSHLGNLFLGLGLRVLSHLGTQTLLQSRLNEAWLLLQLVVNFGSPCKAGFKHMQNAKIVGSARLPSRFLEKVWEPRKFVPVMAVQDMKVKLKVQSKARKNKVSPKERP